MNQAAQKDQEQAMRLIERIPDGQGRTEAVQHVANQLAWQNPKVAAELAAVDSVTEPSLI